MENRTQFFAKLRANRLIGRLRQSQVDGINLVLDATQEHPAPLRAYFLATPWWETGPRSAPNHMTPVTERGPVSYFDKYEPGTKLGKRLGNTVKGDGFRFRGRGLVQITGRDNYKRVGQLINVDLLHEPDLALNKEIAVRILVQGLLHGWFTGLRIGQFINSVVIDFKNARRTVNGLDHAEDIAELADAFLAALRTIPTPIPVPAPEPMPVPPAPVPAERWWRRFWRWLTN